MCSASLLIRLLAVMMFYLLITVHCESTKLHKNSKRVNGEWSKWSACSRPCATGIMERTRICNPKRPRCKPTQTKLCNTHVCPDRGPSLLQSQCSKFDGTVMAGTTYRWVPFYTGREECSLQCRALGYRFYAKLAPKLENGSPCRLTKPSKHVCLNGQCIEVGCDDLVGSNAREDACGVCGGNNSTCRLVSGLFTSPTLNPGYNFVAQIPVNASFIRVSHLDRHSANRIALRTIDGKFILNGMNVSNIINDNGLKISYQNGLSTNGETVTVRGPLTQPIDLMVIYQEPNKGIKYEYRIPVVPPAKEDRNHISRERSPPHSLRHSHAFYSKVYASNLSNTERALQFARHGKPSYSIGGRDYPHIVNEDPANKKVKSKRKKFLWKISGFSECSKSCGGGVQTPIMVCVRESNEVVVPDKRCAYENPQLQEKKCSTKPCPPSWVTSPWTSCSVSCGEGIEIREVSCKQEISSTQTISVSLNVCKHPQPISKRVCYQKACSNEYNQWAVSEWSQCSVGCGIGVSTRSVHCKAGTCPNNERPPVTKECDMGPCGKAGSGHWMHTEWTHKCSEECGKGSQTRRVVCYGSNCDLSEKPSDKRSCSTDIRCEAKWFAGPWQKCTGSCGVGERKRAVLCITRNEQSYHIVDNDMCLIHDKPINREPCLLPDCTPEWFMGDWSECPKSCDSGYQKREVVCLNKHLQSSSECNETRKPNTYHACNLDSCMQKEDDCVDELHNCPTVVQARLCLYNYYKSYCCRSCRRRS